MKEVTAKSEAGKQVLAWAEERLGKARAQLEQPNCDDRSASVLRGRIAELKMLVAWVNDMGVQDE